MAIVDLAYYFEVYMGTEATESEFPAIEARAEDVIGAMTRWAVRADTIASLPALFQTLYKKAICAQMDYFAVNGLDSVTGGSADDFTVGKVSVDDGRTSTSAVSGALRGNIAPLAIMYLEQCGLMNPQVNMMPDVPMGWFRC